MPDTTSRSTTGSGKNGERGIDRLPSTNPALAFIENNNDHDFSGAIAFHSYPRLGIVSLVERNPQAAASPLIGSDLLHSHHATKEGPARGTKPTRADSPAQVSEASLVSLLLGLLMTSKRVPGVSFP